jgi:hypothetical protein
LQTSYLIASPGYVNFIFITVTHQKKIHKKIIIIISYYQNNLKQFNYQLTTLSIKQVIEFGALSLYGDNDFILRMTNFFLQKSSCLDSFTQQKFHAKDEVFILLLVLKIIKEK